MSLQLGKERLDRPLLKRFSEHDNETKPEMPMQMKHARDTGQTRKAMHRASCFLAVGLLAVMTVVRADEKPSHQVLTAVSSTTLSGYISTSAIWKPGTSVSGPQVPAATFLGFTNGHAALSLNVMSGRTNRLDVSTNLVSWETVATFVAPDAVMGSSAATGVSMTHSNAAQLPCFYYRVV